MSKPKAPSKGFKGQVQVEGSCPEQIPELPQLEDSAPILVKVKKPKKFENGEHRKSVEIIYSPHGTIETQYIFPKGSTLKESDGKGKEELSKTNSSGSSGSSGSTRRKKKGTWLEQIQFKAHYEHWRAGSFVNVPSVVRREIQVPVINVEEPPEGSQGSEQSTRSSSSSPSSSSAALPHGCWHFPRKLGRIFSAKSLDDILGRCSSPSSICSTGKGQGHSGKVQNAEKKRSRSRSNSHSAAVGLSTALPQGPLASSVSDNNCYTTSTTKRYLSVPNSRGGATEIEIFRIGRSCASPEERAKSDNCLDRVFASCSTAGRISVDNIESPRGPSCLKKATKMPKNKESLKFSIFKGKPDPSTAPEKLEKPSKSNGNGSKTRKGRIPISKSDSTMSSHCEDPIKVVVHTAFLARPLSPFRIDPEVFSVGSRDRPRPVLSKGKSLEGTQFFSTGLQQEHVPRAPTRRNKVGPISVHFSEDLDTTSSRNVQAQHQRRPTNLSQEESSSSPASNKSPFLVAEAEVVVESGRQGAMGRDIELESPQYVKKTASMFNSRTQSNGSNGMNGSNGTNGVRSPPSYLNVSRSVCGYSCLSYGSSSSGGVPNGGPLQSSSRVNQFLSRAPRPSATNGSGPPKSQSLDEDPSKPHRLPLSSSSTTSTPTSGLEKHQRNGNRVRPQSLHRLGGGEPEEDPYRPGSSGKSFILQKIERLYGAEAVKTGPYFSRPGDPSPARLEPRGRSSERVERIIPIFQEKSNDVCNGRMGRKDLFNSKQASKPPPELKKPDPKPNKVEFKLKPSPAMTDLHSFASSNGNGVNLVELVAQIKSESNQRESSPELPKLPTSHSNGFHKEEDLEQVEAPQPPIQTLYINQELSKDEIDASVASQPQSRVIPINLEADPSCEGDLTREESSISSEELVELDQPIEFTCHTPPKDLEEPPQEFQSQIEQVKASEENSESGSNHSTPEKSVEVMPRRDSGQTDSGNKENEGIEKDGAYFLSVLNSERSKIQRRIDAFTAELDDHEENSERSGKIRAAIGKARLLTIKKFGQFEELCNSNLKEKGQIDENKPFQTKNEDLAGFWDMVLIQVEQIGEMFDELDGITREPPSSSTSKTPAAKKEPLRKIASTSPQKTAGSSRERDESRRRLLAEKRRAMKGNLSNANENTEVQIFSPEAPPKPE